MTNAEIFSHEYPARVLYRQARALNLLYLQQSRAIGSGSFTFIPSDLSAGPQLASDVLRTLAQSKLRRARAAWLMEHGA